MKTISKPIRSGRKKETTPLISVSNTCVTLNASFVRETNFRYQYVVFGFEDGKLFVRNAIRKSSNTYKMAKLANGARTVCAPSLLETLRNEVGAGKFRYAGTRGDWDVLEKVSEVSE